MMTPLNPDGSRLSKSGDDDPVRPVLIMLAGSREKATVTVLHTAIESVESSINRPFPD